VSDKAWADDRMKKYLQNCFLLILPVMAWNVILTPYLPLPYQSEVFWNDIPPFVAWAEQISRILIFVAMLLMPLSIRSAQQRKGLVIYLTGLGGYFFSWFALIYLPESQWSGSFLVFSAPAYTPLLWLGV
jgi:hypothetical protein